MFEIDKFEHWREVTHFTSKKRTVSMVSDVKTTKQEIIEMKNKVLASMVFGVAVFSVTNVMAVSIIDKYDHGSTVQIDIRCDNGSKDIITYYKSSGEYCTGLMSCDSDWQKVARWACG